MTTHSSNGVDRIQSTELYARLGRGDRIAVLDVRHREAWSSDPVSIPGAIWLPLEEVPQRVRDLPADTPLVIYCS